MEVTRMEQIRKMLEGEPLEYEKQGQGMEAIGLIEALLARNAAYCGAYYKLGSLYEQHGLREEAINAYRKGMERTRMLKNKKAYNELQEALQNLED
jgi:tetratricopeptide (TPR) repeat protein